MKATTTKAADQTGRPAPLTAEEVENMTEEQLDAEHRAAAKRFYTLHQQWRQVHDLKAPEQTDQYTTEEAAFEDHAETIRAVHEAKTTWPADFPGAIYTANEAMEVYNKAYALGAQCTAGEILQFCMRKNVIKLESLGTFCDIIGGALGHE